MYRVASRCLTGFALGLLVGLAPLAATAQGAGAGYLPQPQPRNAVTTTGTATIETAAEYAEFEFVKEWDTAADEWNTEAPPATVEEAHLFEEKLRETLEENELAPSWMDVHGPYVKDAKGPLLEIRVRMRFRTAPYLSNEPGNRGFVALCRSVHETARELGCRMTGPRTAIDDPSRAEQAAIARAVEAAYPPAEAVANITRTDIVAVDEVRVTRVAWHAAGTPPAAGKEPEPARDIRRIACTAWVEVVYTFAIIGP